jgi:3-dehydroquinate synthase
MRAAGLVVALGVDVEEAVARANAEPGARRPLLARAAELAAQRAASYRRAHAVVDTTGRSVADVVALVQAVIRQWSELPEHRDATIVALGERSYPITVESGLFSPTLLAAPLGTVTRVALLTDRNVGRSWGAAARSALDAAKISHDTCEIEPGEASKSFAVYEQLCTELIAKGLDRSSAIVALGGGVVGDLAGFVAATLYRGIPVVQLPTTLVAMTDAAIGGKTAIDMPAGKNLVGAFWQPRLVACGLETLTTLPARERKAGFGELWKYALLDGRELWKAVDACTGWATAGGPPPPELRHVIERAVAYKAAIVGRDELERSGQRALLNLGHTVGHAIEAHSGLHHGEAVGLGLVAACRVSEYLGVARPGLATEVTESLRRTGLPFDPSPYLTDEVLGRIGVDKKRIGDKVRFITVREVGACEPTLLGIEELGRILRDNASP